MISKDELVIGVAQSCGVSVEISSFFFEVFINRLSNKLKPGDLLHFHNFGFFHKRNCRIQIEKTADSPTPKSYLIQLVLFSSELKIRNDLAEIHFLKIPNLKSLWVDDKEFQKSLNAGDFSPYTDRNQLIKSFATKAEVIISSLRKDYDNELVEELIIPLTFDLNFLLKSGQKNKTSKNISSVPLKSENTLPISEKAVNPSDEKLKLKDLQKVKEPVDDGLPWNYGTKFSDKDKIDNLNETVSNKTKQEITESKSAPTAGKDLRQDQASQLNNFQRVTPPRPVINESINTPKRSDTVKFSVSHASIEETEKSELSNKFTEVKSKTESFRRGDKYGRSKDGKYDKYSSLKYSNEKAFTARKNFLPIVALVAFIVIALIVVYIYFIEGGKQVEGTNTAILDIKPPPSVNVIDRDYKFIVSYPYPKLENKIEMSGFSDGLFSSSGLKPEIEKETKPEVKTEPIVEKTTKQNEKSDFVAKTEKIPEEIPKTSVENKKADISRIYLYRNFYVVYIGTYSSEETANREADKYFDLGYNAIVENVETRNGKLEYKLSVGDFTSEDFAKQFQEKYIK
jgi:nucleoid DNA-binding protein